MIVDANLWISYLLPSSRPERTVDKLLDLFVSHRATLVVPDDLINELREAILRKPRLSKRITSDDFDAFVRTLRLFGEIVPALGENIPRVTRDPKDDYPLAHALLSDVEVLVSGDADLLSLHEHLDRPQIMTAREFVDLFEST